VAGRCVLVSGEGRCVFACVLVCVGVCEIQVGLQLPLMSAWQHKHLAWLALPCGVRSVSAACAELHAVCSASRVVRRAFMLVSLHASLAT
jgi:hypothetical protein